MAVAAVLLATCFHAAAASADVNGPVNIPNSAIADRAEQYATGSHGGQCLAFVGDMILAAGGPDWSFGFNTNTYQSQWAQRATEISSIGAARRGDVVQWGGGAGGNLLHTAIVTAPGANPSLIDSNWSSTDDELVRRGSFSSRNKAGSSYRIWRVGKVPASIGEGSFVRTPDGNVYRIAGGAPIYVSSWAAFGGSQPYVDISYQQHAAMAPYPANGTFLNSAQDGAVYRVAGGAPIYVSTWNTYGGPQPFVTIDKWAIDHASHPAAHLRTVPDNGTFLNSAQDGAVYRVAGGAPIYVSTWSTYGGPQPSVTIDKWAIDHASHPAAHMRSVPLDGTFVHTPQDGAVYRIAGGAALYVESWGIYGGPQPSVGIDRWAVQNPTNQAAHLRAVPDDGTVLRGLPTIGLWSIVGGRRRPGGESARSVTVSDSAVLKFPLEDLVSCSTAKSGPGCSSKSSERGRRPVNKQLPRILGERRIGEKIHCYRGGWAGGSLRFTVQWIRSGERVRGASGFGYRLRRVDIGKRLRCRVTAHNSAGATPAGSRAIVVRAADRRT